MSIHSQNHRPRSHQHTIVLGHLPGALLALGLLFCVGSSTLLVSPAAMAQGGGSEGAENGGSAGDSGGGGESEGGDSSDSSDSSANSSSTEVPAGSTDTDAADSSSTDSSDAAAETSTEASSDSTGDPTGDVADGSADPDSDSETADGTESDGEAAESGGSDSAESSDGGDSGSDGGDSSGDASAGGDAEGGDAAEGGQDGEAESESESEAESESGDGAQGESESEAESESENGGDGGNGGAESGNESEGESEHGNDGADLAERGNGLNDGPGEISGVVELSQALVSERLRYVGVDVDTLGMNEFRSVSLTEFDPTLPEALFTVQCPCATTDSGGFCSAYGSVAQCGPLGTDTNNDAEFTKRLVIPTTTVVAQMHELLVLRGMPVQTDTELSPASFSAAETRQLLISSLSDMIINPPKDYGTGSKLKSH